VNGAIVQMNHVTQQNAASSEESSSAAAELSGQSRELAAMIGTFQLERGGAGQGRDAQPRQREGRPAVPGRAGARLHQNGAHRFGVPTA
jgi:methyl-accepting chemotaxis protein